MKFKVLNDEMNYGMSMVLRAVPAKATFTAMEGVLVETEEDHLILTCTNGEMSVRAQVPSVILEEGTALLPAKLFGEIMRKQPAGEVSIDINERRRAQIRSMQSKTSLEGMDQDEYPEINEPAGERELKINCSLFRQAVSRVLFAVSQDEARKILTGVLMEATEDHVVFVGLDGFRLAMQKVENKNDIPENARDGKLSCVIPGTVMTEISRMIPDDPEKILDIQFNSSHIVFSFENIKLYASLLTGEFIDYRKILPAGSTTQIMIELSRLNEAIDRCSLIAREGKNNLIQLNIRTGESEDDGNLIMSANAENGEAHEEIPIKADGKDLDIAFNSRYLTEVAHNVDDTQIVMCFNSNVSPCLIRPVSGDQYRFLVLPVRVFGK